MRNAAEVEEEEGVVVDPQTTVESMRVDNWMKLMAVIEGFPAEAVVAVVVVVVVVVDRILHQDYRYCLRHWCRLDRHGSGLLLHSRRLGDLGCFASSELAGSGQ